MDLSKLHFTLSRPGISADTALRLARFFGGAAQFWINLQSPYDLAEAEAKAGKIEKLMKRYTVFFTSRAERPLDALYEVLQKIADEPVLQRE